MKDSLCFTFSQNLVTKVGFLPLSENKISSETEILHGVDDLFYPQHLHHQQKCCFSRGLLGRAVGVSYAVWHGGRFMLPVADGQMPDQCPDTWSKEGPWPSAKLDWRLTRDMNGTHGQLSNFFTAAGSNRVICTISAPWLDRKKQPSDEVWKRATGARMHVRNVLSGLFRMHALTSPEKQLFDLGVSLYNHNCDVISLPYFPDLRKVFLEFLFD